MRSSNLFTEVLFCTIICFQAAFKTRSYPQDNFWLSTVSFQQKIDKSLYNNLWEIAEAVAADIHNIALANNMDPKVMLKWLRRVNFMNALTKNIGNQPQDWAMQKVKEKCGSNMGMKKSAKKLAEKIIQENSRHQQL